jgi:uracil-DNA glycosylase
MSTKIIFRIKGESHEKAERRAIRNKILSLKKDDYITSILNKLPLHRDALSIIVEYLTYDSPQSNLLNEDYSYNIITRSNMMDSKFTDCILKYCFFYKVEMYNNELIRSSLNNVSFYGVDLTNSTLQDVNYLNGIFNECILEGMKVSHSKIDGSTFTGTNLINGATFRHSSLEEVKFLNVTLSNVTFEDVILKKGSFNNTTLHVIIKRGSQQNLTIKGGKLPFLIIENGNLTNSTLLSIKYGKLNIQNTPMKKIKLDRIICKLSIDNCDMGNAQVSNCSFSNTKLSRISLNNATFNNFNTWNTFMNEVKGENVSFDDSSFSADLNAEEPIDNSNIWKKVELSKIKISGSHFHMQKLDFCNFTEMELAHCSFGKTTFYQFTLTTSTISNVDFNKCNFKLSKLNKITFMSSKFNRCSFEDTIMEQVEFHDCEFEKCVFTKTDLDKTKFLNTDIGGIKLVESKGVSTTSETKEEDIPDDITIYEVASKYPPVGWKEHFKTKDSELKRVSNLIDKSRRDTGDEITPPNNCIFRAFQLTPLSTVRVVIIGQDPYPAAGVATGLAFSTHPFSPVPASLKNIYKEIAASCKGFEIPDHGCLDGWAKQGVFLINTCLTCPVGKAGGHSKYNIWIPFISSVLKLIGETNKDCFYMLWGKPAQECKQYIKGKEDRILCTSHPSPLSASRGFLGCGHFALVNKKLVPPIKW